MIKEVPKLSHSQIPQLQLQIWEISINIYLLSRQTRDAIITQVIFTQLLAFRIWNVIDFVENLQSIICKTIW